MTRQPFIFPDLTLVENGVKLVFEWIGEGRSGDYDPSDPEDTPLLRFSFYVLDDGGEWVDPGDASYCTLIPAEIDDTEDWSKQRDRLLTIARELMADASGAVRQGTHKKLLEAWSWIGVEV